MLTKQQVEDFYAAAVADGWDARATYDGHEPIERAFKLERDGFVISGLNRDRTYKLSGWGPDRLAIQLPVTYDLDSIKAALKICQYCHENVDEVRRVGFAGRVCNDCHPAVAARVERPGWTN